MRLLFVVPKHTGVLDSGSQQRTWFLARALAREAETDVLVLAANRAAATEEARLLETGVRRVYYLQREVPAAGIWSRLVGGIFPYRELPQMAERYRELHRLGEYHGAVFRYLRTFAAVGEEGGRPTLIDVDDLDTQTVRSKADLPDAHWSAGLKARMRSVILRRAMLSALGKSKAVWLSREADRRETSLKNSFILPNLPMERLSEPNGLPGADPLVPTLGFLGRMSWPVNIRGIDAFLTKCWPLVLREVPQARLHIAGSALSDELATKWGRAANVQVLGRVENVADFYRGISFAICPLFEGGGTKIKVLEALMHRRTVVVAAPSLAGYEDSLRPEEELLMGRDWHEFAHACIRLLRDTELRLKLEQQGSEAVKRSFSWSRFQEAVSAGLRFAGL